MRKQINLLTLAIALTTMSSIANAQEWQNPFNINPSIQQFAELPNSQQNAICQYYIAWAVGTDKTSPETTDILRSNPETAQEYANNCITFINSSTDKELKAFHFFLNSWDHFK